MKTQSKTRFDGTFYEIGGVLQNWNILSKMDENQRTKFKKRMPIFNEDNHDTLTAMYSVFHVLHDRVEVLSSELSILEIYSSLRGIIKVLKRMSGNVSIKESLEFVREKINEKNRGKQPRNRVGVAELNKIGELLKSIDVEDIYFEKKMVGVKVEQNGNQLIDLCKMVIGLIYAYIGDFRKNGLYLLGQFFNNQKVITEGLDESEIETIKGLAKDWVEYSDYKPPTFEMMAEKDMFEKDYTFHSGKRRKRSEKKKITKNRMAKIC